MQKIVPLDDSKEAEKVVRLVEELCQKGDSVILLRVIKPDAAAKVGSTPGKRLRGGFVGLSGGVSSLETPDVPVYVETIDQAFERQTAEAKDFLEGFATELRAHGIITDTEVLSEEHAGNAIVQYARNLKPTVIAMLHKTRFNISEFLPGRVANQVVQSEIAPVLLVPSRV